MAAPDWMTIAESAEARCGRKEYAEAARLAEQALKMQPNCAAAYHVLGIVCLERGRAEEGIERLRRALTIRPDLARSHLAMGRCYLFRGDPARALEEFDRAVFLKPGYAEAHFDRAQALLKLGRFKEGWAEYEWRWPCNYVARPSIPRPRWDGTPLGGKSILVHTEQGLGDVLQFIRLLPLLKREPFGAGRVVLACQTALQRLLRKLASVDEWFPIGEPGAVNFDFYTPLLSLPGLLGIDEGNIPREVPYVTAEAERVEQWRGRIAGMPGIKVGLCWQGSPTFPGDAFRSIPLAQFEPLAKVDGVTLISLQKGAGEEQIEANEKIVPLKALGELDRDGAFVDRAAIMQHLDLVITSDTSVAHLAGALGRRVWVILWTGCDWRWLIGRVDSPWYPSMRLFRQRSPEDWAGVMGEVADALTEL
jgi:hypothetical protein